MKNSGGGKSNRFRRRTPSAKAADGRWLFRLYVAGESARTVLALKNLKIICKEALKDNYLIEVVDLVKQPLQARKHQILAIPTLVRTHPLPSKSIIGDLSRKDRVLAGLELAAGPTSG